MTNTWDLLRKRLNTILEPYGNAADFCRKIGISRTTVEKWLNNQSAPNIKLLDKIALGLNQKSWQLIQPEEDKSQTERVIPFDLLKKIQLLSNEDKEKFFSHVELLLVAFQPSQKETKKSSAKG